MIKTSATITMVILPLLLGKENESEKKKSDDIQKSFFDTFDEN